MERVDFFQSYSTFSSQYRSIASTGANSSLVVAGKTNYGLKVAKDGIDDRRSCLLQLFRKFIIISAVPKEPEPHNNNFVLIHYEIWVPAYNICATNVNRFRVRHLQRFLKFQNSEVVNCRTVFVLTLVCSWVKNLRFSFLVFLKRCLN